MDPVVVENGFHNVMVRSPDKGREDQSCPLISHKVEATAPSFYEQAVDAFEPLKKLLISDDDPFRPFKGKTAVQKLKIALCYIFPILGWLPNYKREDLVGDIIAAVTVLSLSVPEGPGYAKLAKLPPVYGLCKWLGTAVAPVAATNTVYAVLGSSRHIIIGPVAVVSLLLGNLLSGVYDPVTQAADYLNLAITSTFFAGVFQFGLGFCRLGFITDFMSHAVVLGFMAGSSVTISCSQLKSLLGYKDFTTKTDIIDVFQSIIDYSNQFNWESFTVGGSFLVVLLSLRVLSYRNKGNKWYFFLNATGPILAVITSTLAVFITKANHSGVSVVGHLKSGLNPLSLRHIVLGSQYFSAGMRIGLISGLIALTEGISIARTFASLKGYHIDGNKEMLAMGAMNLVGSMTSCYVTTGSFSRSAVNYSAGGNTPLVLLIMAACMMLVLSCLTSLFYYLPNAVLSAIIINAVVKLIDLPSAYHVWKTDKLDFLALLGAFLGVILISVEIGLLIAVLISMIKVIVQATRPQVRVLGRLPGTSVYRNVQQYPQAETADGILIVRIDSTLYFANAVYVQETVTRLADRYQEDHGKKLHFVILEMTPVADLDTTAIHSLEELLRGLTKMNVQLGLSNPSRGVLWKLQTSGFVDELGEQWLFLSAGDAVRVCSMHCKERIGHCV